MGFDLGASELAIGSLVSTGLSAVTSAIGAERQAQAESGAANYNAAIAAQNQAMARQNAIAASAAGEQQAAMSQQKTRARLGGIITGEAAGNIDVMKGSAVNVQSSERALGLQDALTIKSNAAREAYGYQTQAYNFGAQSNLDKFQAESAAAGGDITAASTLLGGAASAGNEYARFLQAGAL